MSNLRRLMLALLVVGLGATSASAQAIFGTFSWQMQPYCNSVTLSLISMPTGFTVEGIEDQCNGPNKGSAVGTAAFNASGNLLLNFTIGLPNSRPVQVSAYVSPANGEGTWTDEYGNSGTFKFFGATPGLPPRPVHTITAVAGQVFAGELSVKFYPNYGTWEMASVSFPSPLPASVAAPVVEYVPGAPTATCPGAGRAAAGRFCVYGYNVSNIATVSTLNSPAPARPYGLTLYVNATNVATVGWLFASWAYRVP